MAIEAVLFDLDGTLADTARDLLEACNHVLRKYRFAELSLAEIRRNVSLGASAMLAAAVPDGQAALCGRDSVMRREFLDYYAEHVCERTVLFDGFDEVLPRLRQRGFKLAVVTGKYTALARRVLSGLGIEECFDAVVGSDLAPRPKPDPSSLLHALSLLGVGPRAALYLGDHRNDALAALSCGAVPAAAGWGYGGDDVRGWGARHVLERPRDLLSILAP